MTYRSVLALTWAAGVACVGVHPEWDPPRTSDHAIGSDDDAGSTAATTTGDADEPSTAATAEPPQTTGDDAKPKDAEDDAGAASSGDASSDDSVARDCPEPDHSICDGVCKKTVSDRHFCGPECIDCEVMFGGDADCDHGVCVRD